jgi:hypothetical protein
MQNPNAHRGGCTRPCFLSGMPSAIFAVSARLHRSFRHLPYVVTLYYQCASVWERLDNRTYNAADSRKCREYSNYDTGSERYVHLQQWDVGDDRCLVTFSDSAIILASNHHVFIIHDCQWWCFTVYADKYQLAQNRKFFSTRNVCKSARISRVRKREIRTLAWLSVRVVLEHKKYIAHATCVDS